MPRKRDPLNVKRGLFQSKTRKRYNDPLGVAPQSIFQKLKNKLRQPKRGRVRKN